MTEYPPPGGFQLGPARENHAIHGAPAQATADGLDASLLATLIGTPDSTDPVTFTRRDAITGAHARIVQQADGWGVAWIDGPRHPGSGEALARVIVVDMAGGVIQGAED